MKKFLGYKGRSIWKGYSLKSTLKNIFLNRVYVVRKADIGKEVYIYNGKNFLKFNILLRHVGYKLGQFFITKKIGRAVHKKNFSKKDKKKKK